MNRSGGPPVTRPDRERDGGYRTIVADPPWNMPSGGTHAGGARWHNNPRRPSDLPYEPMTLDAIKTLDVAALAEDDAHLYLWIPNAYLEHAHDVARAWGFRPSQMLVWCKTPRGIGLGGAFTNTAEFVLFARRGSLPALSRLDSSWFNWKRPHNNHSAKPEAFLDLVESVSPGPYLEMFARRQRLGWDTWGDQALNHVEMAAR
jgi:N6-adenosine-specific RNA methylase IME4